jgi:exodeoxyribonuclease V gamma subunit
MISLHYSNRLEILVEPLAQAVKRQQRMDPIAPISIIVPNRAIEQFVKFRLAERLGVAANLQFPFLRTFLARLVTQADSRMHVLEVDGLRMLLFECLRSAAVVGNPAFAPVQAYLDAEDGDSAQRELRLFRIADRLAPLMREYSITRGEMLAGWPRRSFLKMPPYAETERWQRELWELVIDQDRAVREEFLLEREQKWMMLPHAMDAVAEDDLRRTLPGEIHVFALPNAGPAYVRIIGHLGKLTTVNVYAVNPCLEFWEDLNTVGATKRARMIRRGERIEDPFADEPDRFHLVDEADTLALKLWGRPGREYIRLLNQLTDCDFDPHYVRPASGPKPTLLAALQDDILLRNPDRNRQHLDAAQFEDDSSIRILACPGTSREAEIVASAIWSVVKDSSGPNPIRFHEIAVLIPDASIEAYLPHLESVFERQHRIPIEIAGRRFVHYSRVAEAVELLLALPMGRFTRDEIVRIITHPAVAGAEPECDPERWSAWCAEAGVLFGADREHLANTYLDGNLYHWDQALSRIALGVFMTGERSGDTRLAETAGGSYLPLELGQEAGDGAMRLVRRARELIADATAIGAARLTLPQWSRALTAMVSKYVHESDAAGARVLGWCLQAIAEMAPEEFRGAAVGYEIAREVAAAALAEAESAQGQIRGRGVAVGSMLALRSLPYRAIFVMGLGEATFPARERRDPMDLARAERKVGDVPASERDRYLFLEAILAARERIFLTYVNRNPQTGETLEPSAVVRELEFILCGYLDESTLKNLTIVHPVSRYDLRYFRELPQPPADGVHPELSSFDFDAMRGARMASLRMLAGSAAKGAALPGRDDPLLDYLPAALQPEVREAVELVTAPASGTSVGKAPEEIAVSLTALRRYLECPLQGAARYALGMNDEEDEAEAADADEPLQQTRMDRVMLLREVFSRAGGIDDPALDELWESRFKIAEMQARAPAGVFAGAARESDRAELKRWYEQASASGADDVRCFHEVRMGAADEFARAAETLDPLIIDLEVAEPGGELRTRRVRINGTLGLMRRQRADGSFDMALHAILPHKVMPVHFLRIALGMVVLSAAGQPVAPAFTAAIVGAADKKPEVRQRTIAPPAREDARKYLSALVSDLLSAGNDYFLPIEAVEAARKEIRRGGSPDDLVAAVEGLRDGSGEKSRSAYGPVRDAWVRFEAPAGDEIARIIRRRYQSIDFIFGAEAPERE